MESSNFGFSLSTNGFVLFICFQESKRHREDLSYRSKHTNVGWIFVNNLNPYEIDMSVCANPKKIIHNIQ